MIKESIEFYTSYFSLAAISGIAESKSIYETLSVIQSVNVRSFSVFQDAVSARNNLFTTLKSSYETLFTNAISTHPMKNAFDGLAKYISENSGQTVDEYLTEKSIQVSREYANISQILGEDISSNNVLNG